MAKEMVPKILIKSGVEILTYIYFFIAISSFGQSNAVQQYTYADNDLEIYASSQFSFEGQDTLSINVEIRNKGKEIYLLKENQFAVNKTGGILILDCGGMFVSYLDNEIELIKLNIGDNHLFKFRISRSELQNLDSLQFISVSLSLGYVKNQNLKNNEISAQTNESKTIKISTILLDEILDRKEFGMFMVKI